MSAIKDGCVSVLLDKERKILFSINVLDEMQDKLGGFDKLESALKGPNVFKNIKWLLTRLVNEGMDDGEESLTEDQIGKMVHAGNLNAVTAAIYGAFNRGTTGDDPIETGTDDDIDSDEGDAEDDADDIKESKRKNAVKRKTL